MVDPREAQDNYVPPASWVRTMPTALPVPDPPTPPCDGSYTDQWESTEAIHGSLVDLDNDGFLDIND